jgi:hypothetical protein
MVDRMQENKDDIKGVVHTLFIFRESAHGIKLSLGRKRFSRKSSGV